MMSIKELREWTRHLDENPHLGTLTESGKLGLLAIADTIETEIAGSYMPLPLDMDGVPVHLGDMLTSDAYADGEAVGIDCYKAPNGTRYGISVLPAWWDTPTVHDPAAYRHVKPRTIEDVLRDCYAEVNYHLGEGKMGEIITKYAAEIREVLGVEE